MNQLTRRDLFKYAAGAALFSAIPRPLFAESHAEAPGSPAAFSFYKFKIGDWDAWSISDGSLAFPSVQPFFAKDSPKEQVDAVLRSEFLPTDHVDFQVNVLAVKTPQGVLLVDAGSGQFGGPTSGFLQMNLLAAGIKPADVTAVILSHGHSDHLGGLIDAEGRLAFPNATIYANKTEVDYWTTQNPDISHMTITTSGQKELVTTLTAIAHKVFAAIEKKIQKVAPGDKILDSIELLAAPGHTPGHLNIVFKNGSEQLLHLVDTVHLPMQMAHPEWAMIFDYDVEIARQTRKKAFARAAAERTRLFTYHVSYPGVGYIRPEGKGYEWIPETWKWS